MLRLLYTVVFYLALPFVLLRIWFKGRKNKAYRDRISERFGHVPFQLEQSIWLHAVSLGEAVAAIPLIEDLLKFYPDFPVVVTTTTPTGSAKIIEHFGARVFHSYLPYDVPLFLMRFFKAIQPRLLLIMEVELWPNLLRCAQKNKVPVMVVNARMSDRSFKRYHYFKSWIGKMFNQIDLIAAQSDFDAHRFIDLGARIDQVVAVGNLKFDVQVNEDLRRQALEMRAVLSHHPVWIAASTHPGEEAQILKIHQALLKKHPQALLILVPRHPERFLEVQRLCGVYGFRFVTRSSDELPMEDTQVFLGDSMGELQFYYALADIAFVGGTLVDIGGHNPLEPLALGKKVVVGPYIQNARTLYKDLESVQLVQIFDDFNLLSDALLSSLQAPVDPVYVNSYIGKFRGVSGRIISLIGSFNLEKKT